MRLIWMPLAMDDRDEIFSYIELDDFAAAVRLDDLFETEAESLTRFSRRGKPGRIRDTYELVLASTPYILVYEVKAEAVRIHRVMHGAREWPESVSGTE